MSHEVKIYIKQADYLETKSYVRPYTDDSITYRHFKYQSRPANAVKSNKIIVANSMNPVIDQFWIDNNLDLTKLQDWRKRNKKIIVMDWECERAADSVTDSDTIIEANSDTNVYVDYLYYDNKQTDFFVALSRNPRIATFITEKYLTDSAEGDPILEYIGTQRHWPIFKFDGDLVYGYDKTLDIYSYRIYHDTRLLTERFYPIEQGGNYHVVETVGLEIGGTLRLANNYDLIIDKVSVDGVETAVGSWEYTLTL